MKGCLNCENPNMRKITHAFNEIKDLDDQLVETIILSIIMIHKESDKIADDLIAYLQKWRKPNES